MTREEIVKAVDTAFVAGLTVDASGLAGIVITAFIHRDPEAFISALEALGLAVVPRKPTEVMIDAAEDKECQSPRGTAIAMWRAMLAAAEGSE